MQIELVETLRPGQRREPEASERAGELAGGVGGWEEGGTRGGRLPLPHLMQDTRVRVTVSREVWFGARADERSPGAKLTCKLGRTKYLPVHLESWFLPGWISLQLKNSISPPPNYNMITPAATICHCGEDLPQFLAAVLIFSPPKGQTKIPRLGRGRGSGGADNYRKQTSRKQVNRLRDQLSKNGSKQLPSNQAV